MSYCAQIIENNIYFKREDIVNNQPLIEVVA